MKCPWAREVDLVDDPYARVAWYVKATCDHSVHIGVDFNPAMFCCGWVPCVKNRRYIPKN
jgi:hypothetical protein